MTHKRITERRLSDDETAKAAALIAGENRRGVVDGVEVDLCHPSLDPADWEPLPQWYVGGNSGVVFPSEWSHPEWPRFKEDREILDCVELHAGDRLTVESVVPEIGDGRFDHPHDRQFQRAYLRVERPSGEILSGIGPLAFFGRTKIRNAATREAFDHILERICLHTGKPLYEQGPNGSCMPDPSWSGSLEDVARAHAAEAHDAYFRLLALLPEQGLAPAYLRMLANDAALAGFLLGKAELRKAERTAGAILDNAARGAEKVTRTDWREKAKRLWAENPRWTTNRVATVIAQDDGLAEVRSVSRSIRHLAPPTSPSHKKA